MRRPALVLLPLLVVFLLGCGAGGDGDDDQESAPIGAQAVIQEFEQVPGMPPLQPAAGSDPSWEQLGLGLDLPPADQRRFGTFTIYVVDPEDPEAVRSLLADKDTGEQLQPDADGIYWDYDELARSYVAQKRYGENVVLAWWNESRKQGTDERWERLDEVLAGLANT